MVTPTLPNAYRMLRALDGKLQDTQQSHDDETLLPFTQTKKTQLQIIIYANFFLSSTLLLVHFLVFDFLVFVL